MKTRLLLLGTLGFILISIATSSISSQSEKEELVALEMVRVDRRDHEWYVRAAKAKGQSQINLPVLICGDYGVPDSLDEAIRHSWVLVAEAVEKKSVPFASNAIETWYRFRIIENLSGTSLPQCGECADRDLDVPKEMLSSLKSDEILVPTSGGTLKKDGVVLVASFGNRGPYQFDLSEKYILFLKADSSGQIGLLTMGPTGIFGVSDADRLEPNLDSQHALQSEVISRFGSAEFLRTHIRKKLR